LQNVENKIKQLISNRSAVIIATNVLMTIFLLCIGFLPVKLAVKENQINRNRNFLIVERILTTAPTTWNATSENNVKIKYPMFVKIEGKEPSYYHLSMPDGERAKFICYGKSIEKVNTEAGEYTLFQSTDWDVLYPIGRTSKDLPKSWICFYDLFW
jgi:hypothetical protein